MALKELTAADWRRIRETVESLHDEFVRESGAHADVDESPYEEIVTSVGYVGVGTRCNTTGCAQGHENSCEAFVTAFGKHLEEDEWLEPEETDDE